MGICEDRLLTRRAVAMNIRNGDAKLVLLCPVWEYGTTRSVKPGTIILQAWLLPRFGVKT